MIGAHRIQKEARLEKADWVMIRMEGCYGARHVELVLCGVRSLSGVEEFPGGFRGSAGGSTVVDHVCSEEGVCRHLLKLA